MVYTEENCHTQNHSQIQGANSASLPKDLAKHNHGLKVAPCDMGTLPFAVVVHMNDNTKLS